MRVDPATTAEIRRLNQQITAVLRTGLALPGSLTHRHTRCGRAGCKCGSEPPRPHGPYWSWTRKVDAKTVTRYLTDEQYQDYRPYFDNARTLRDLIAQLEALSLATIDEDPRWTRRNRRRPRPHA
ncbi:MAG: DUF6788 family protein [Mycobacteriales bacterium]